MAWHDPTTSELARSIGCRSEDIVRSELNRFKTAQRTDGKQVWTSFVDQGDPERVAVFETEWPQ